MHALSVLLVSQLANVLLKNSIHGSYGQVAKVSHFGLANVLMEGATHRRHGAHGNHHAPGTR